MFNQKSRGPYDPRLLASNRPAGLGCSPALPILADATNIVDLNQKKTTIITNDIQNDSYKIYLSNQRSKG